MLAKIIKIASAELGVKEISGKKHNSRIVQYAKETGIKGIDSDEVPWCSTFVNWCAKKAKLPISGKANARSWINVGKNTQKPEPGDIVVFWRESIYSWKGHVGIFFGYNYDASRVFCLGGNQADAVTIEDYDVKKVLSFRRLDDTQTIEIPKPVLKLGSKGKEVIKLQIVLNHLRYNCGDADGDFGAKTEDALKVLQADQMLKVDGIYGKKCKNRIESLLQS